jgi:sirohydrochlorin ferrochelatase
MPSPVISGVVLLGHGSREPGTEAEIKALGDALARALAARRFTHAFLNQDPKLEAAVDALRGEGCSHIRVLPLLVFTGRHMTEDVPAEIARLRRLHPTLTLELDPYLFRLPGFSDLLVRALSQPSAAESVS